MHTGGLAYLVQQLHELEQQMKAISVNISPEIPSVQIGNILTETIH